MGDTLYATTACFLYVGTFYDGEFFKSEIPAMEQRNPNKLQRREQRIAWIPPQKKRIPLGTRSLMLMLVGGRMLQCPSGQGFVVFR